MSLTAEQQKNAQAIIAAGQARGESQANITIAIMVALTESGLRNLTYGDRDSVGLFQQRASWGSVATREDPTASANLFYDRLDTTGSSGLSPWMLAQKVQVSAFSDGSNYKKNYDQAVSIVGSSGGSVETVSTGVGGSVLDNAGNLFTSIIQPGFWVRVGVGALGGGLVLVAILNLLGKGAGVSDAVATGKNVAGSVAKFVPKG